MYCPLVFLFTQTAAIHATSRLPCRWQAAADQTMQQSGASSDQKRQVLGRGRHAPA